MTTYILVGAAALAVVMIILWLIFRPGKSSKFIEETSSNAQASPIQVVTKESGLKIETLKAGSGTRTSNRGDSILVHYTRWLTNGQKFDSSVDRGTPFEFKLGQGKVIQGWEEGLRGMKVGEKRRLTVPPKSGYGNRGTGRIPPR